MPSRPGRYGTRLISVDADRRAGRDVGRVAARVGVPEASAVAVMW
jgi:hypothetical protein